MGRGRWRWRSVTDMHSPWAIPDDPRIAQRPEPTFDHCGNCGAPSSACSWDPVHGWCCAKCGGMDSDE